MNRTFSMILLLGALSACGGGSNAQASAEMVQAHQGDLDSAIVVPSGHTAVAWWTYATADSLGSMWGRRVFYECPGGGRCSIAEVWRSRTLFSTAGSVKRTFEKDKDCAAGCACCGLEQVTYVASEAVPRVPYAPDGPWHSPAWHLPCAQD